MNPEDYRDIFEPFEKLVSIEIAGEVYAVPENNSLLRCFQFLSMQTISYGDFCWNGECSNCRIWLAEDDREKAALACRTRVREGIRIIRVNEKIEITDNG